MLEVQAEQEAREVGKARQVNNRPGHAKGSSNGVMQHLDILPVFFWKSGVLMLQVVLQK